MSWTRVNIIAEGQTEETFVRDVLTPHLAEHKVAATCRRVETGRKKKLNVIHRGGLISYKKAKGDIERWLRQDRTAYVTTMFDLYALPTDFPGRDTGAKLAGGSAKVEHLEKKWVEDIGDRRFVPYIQLHEFEALLFSDVHALDEALRLTETSKLKRLQAIRDEFSSPEEINEGPKTAPSKRLLKLFPGYDKVVYGSLASQRIGLETIRRHCPHFHQWVTRLELLPDLSD